MDHCTIYSHKPIYQELTKLLSTYDFKSEIEEKNGFITIILKQKGSLFKAGKTLKISYRERKHPSYQLSEIQCDLSQNLAGMLEFVGSIKAKNTEIQALLMKKIETINCEVSLSGIPKYSDEMKEILAKICDEFDPFIFAAPSKYFSKSKKQHFLDHQLNLIIDTRGNSEIEKLSIEIDPQYFDKTVKISPAEKRRKEASEALLNAKGIKVNLNLPIVNEEVIIRKKSSIINRAYALAVITAAGESVPKEQIDNIIEKLHITEFSEKEQSILNNGFVDDQEKANAVWRYESLNLILWALGKLDSIDYPSNICNVEKIVGIMLKDSREVFENDVKVRSKDEILDQLDLIYRMNWACVDARINQIEPDGNLMTSVVYERHYALNWLVNYQQQSWDEISTDT